MPPTIGRTNSTLNLVCKRRRPSPFDIIGSKSTVKYSKRQPSEEFCVPLAIQGSNRLPVSSVPRSLSLHCAVKYDCTIFQQVLEQHGLSAEFLQIPQLQGTWKINGIIVLDDTTYVVLIYKSPLEQ
uniref:Uncharacterized protein n=1 Tax=Cucumis melo TaxID=3656 RepID=A0A9I9E7L8_CUCME